MFAAITLPGWPPSPACAILVLAMTPTALIGDRLPALAPLATISAVRKYGIRARALIAMASGATSATLETAPGPTAEIAQAIAKNIGGSSGARPPISRTARFARLARVPLVSAAAK